MRSVIGAPSAPGLSGRGPPPPDFAEKTAAGAQAGPEDRVVRDKQERFATSVKELNQARLQKKVYPVLAKFAKVEEPTGVDVSLILARMSIQRLTKYLEHAKAR